MHFFVKSFFVIALTLVLFSCAPTPVQEEGASASESTGQAADAEADQQAGSGQVSKGSEFDTGGTPHDLPVDEIEPYHQENPDWKARYEKLYDFYVQRHRRPPLGITISLRLASGREVRGTVSRITKDQVFLNVEDGEIGYSAESLSPKASSIFFPASYAHHRALQQGRLEYSRWQQLQRSTADAQRGAAPDQETVEASSDTAKVSSRRFAPKNEGPNGHVWQVEDYIRKNAALPDTLKVKAWGQVQPHESGYKVRVQYSLKSTAGLGTSHEDMMFFMSSSGRVYQRAAVK